MEYRFQTLDYCVAAVLLIFSAAYGLYVSNVKHKQTTLIEYFLAEKNISIFLIILSYFSSYCTGPMTGQAIEIYLFGSQNMAYVFIPLAMIPAIQYVAIPVFYPLQNMSMLKYFDLRFGKTVTTISLIATITGMILTGSVNIFVSAIAIQQVSAISFWVSATIITIICILYSTLGGMRAIIVTDAIHAFVMIVSILLIVIIGVIKCGGRNAVWEIGYQYDRLELFNFNFDPSVRYTFWSTFIGYGFMVVFANTLNQTLLQRCIMAPNIKSAQKILKIGFIMGSAFIFLYQVLGLITFAYYKGCNLQHSGKISSINQLNSYFAMEILHDYPALPGLYFSGLISTTLSTISSILNSVAALIVAQCKHINNESKSGAILCQIIVLFFGLIMFSIIFILENFSSFAQASMTFASLTCGPIFAVFCIAILCPKSNSKCVAISFLMALAFGCYILIGSVLVKSKDLPKPFANCTFNATSIRSVNTNSTIQSVEENIFDAYFPLNKISFLYISLQVFTATIISFIFFTCVLGQKKQDDVQFDLKLIPPCVQQWHLKMNKKWRQVFLCDVYETNEQQHIMLSNVNLH